MIRHQVIGLTYTRTCPLACRHCITESSPHAKGRMTVEQARRYIPAIARFTSLLSFTGGEALLYHRDILALTSEAKAAGLQVSVVTGAGWVKNEAMARSRLRALRAAGVGSLVVSWDGYHEEFAPRENALTVVRLACEIGLGVTLRTVIRRDGRYDEYHAPFAAFPIRFEVIMVGRLGSATGLPADHFLSHDAPPKGVCGIVTSPVIEPDGTVYACCGPGKFSSSTSPLRLGNAEEEPLEDILGRGCADPILEAISLIGPHGLATLLQGDAHVSPRFQPRPMYTGICELCLDINNSPPLVAALRRRLEEPDAQIMLAAARMWAKRRTRKPMAQVPPPAVKEGDGLSNAG
jgi:MoaA/NifB/PqqE/SkfB family radical SAM enzyme